MTIIRNIEKYCEIQGITTAEFERRCNLGHSSVGKWKRGIASPSVRILEKIANATNIPVDEWLKEGA